MPVCSPMFVILTETVTSSPALTLVGVTSRSLTWNSAGETSGKT